MAACGFLFQRSHPLTRPGCLHHFPSAGPGAHGARLRDANTAVTLRAEGASILLHADRSRVQRVLHRWEGGKPSLRNVMDSRSRGSFCFKLTLNSIEQPLKFPRVALRSSERQTEKAYCLCIRGAITVLGWRNAFRCDIPSDCS